MRLAYVTFWFYFLPYFVILWQFYLSHTYRQDDSSQIQIDLLIDQLDVDVLDSSEAFVDGINDLLNDMDLSEATIDEI